MKRIFLIMLVVALAGCKTTDPQKPLIDCNNLNIEVINKTDSKAEMLAKLSRNTKKQGYCNEY